MLRIGFTEETLLVFKEFVIFKEGGYIFPSLNKLQDKNEELFYDGRSILVSENYIEINITESIYISEVFIFSTMVDAMAFYQLKKINFSNTLFLIIGVSPSVEILKKIQKSKNPKIKYSFVFRKTLFGNILDVKCAFILSNIEGFKIKISEGYIIITLNDKNYKIPKDRFSLSIVRKTLLKHLPYRTYKAKGYETFFQQIQFKK